MRPRPLLTASLALLALALSLGAAPSSAGADTADELLARIRESEGRRGGRGRGRGRENLFDQLAGLQTRASLDAMQKAVRARAEGQ